jgi:hypothetical protein
MLLLDGERRMEIDSSTVLKGIMAVFLALTVGSALSQAKSTAILPLIGECWTVLLGNGESLQLMICGIGIVLYASVPGAIGIFLMTMRSR